MTILSYYIKESDSAFANMFPEHLKRKCTVFLTGGCPWMLEDAPAPVEVYNDLDSGVLYLFETLRNVVRREAFHKLLDNVPSFKKYDLAQLMKGYRDTTLQDLDRITLWYICARSILREHLKDLGAKKLFHRVGDYEVFKRNSKAAFIYRELQEVDAILPEIHGRLFRMQFEHYPFEKVIQIYDSAETLFVADLDHLPAVDDHTKKEVHAMLQNVEGSTFTFCAQDNGYTIGVNAPLPKGRGFSA